MPAVFPYTLPQTLEWKVRNFPDNIYNFNPGDHLTNLMTVLLGDAGTGQLGRVQTSAQINETLYGMEFGDIDSIMGALLSIQRYSFEGVFAQAISNPFLEQLNWVEWDTVDGGDTNFRERVILILQALGLGATPQGISLLCEGITGCPCDVVESWQNPNFSRFPVSGGVAEFQNEFVVIPRVNSLQNTRRVFASESGVYFSKEIQSAAYVALQRFKPEQSIASVAPQVSGSPAYTGELPNFVLSDVQIPVRQGFSDFEMFEFTRVVTGPASLSVPPVDSQLPIINSRYWLSSTNPSTTLAPTFAHHRRQECSLDMTNSVSKVQGFVYGVQVPSTNGQVPAQSWGPWQEFELADSPDNYPNGKYPADPAHRGPTGVYLYSWASQLQYVTFEIGFVESVGGQFVFDGDSKSLGVFRLPQSSNYETAIPSSVGAILAPQPVEIASTVYGAL